ncbi:DUF5916 domain-containing protein [Longimicrobium terrae]|uniref:DUF5916 domain-containing protein n=1 Tax=Longimicrobium terrae TaxID=1639882 RepID=A0A841GXP0_9BACT|nr:hypothetical protein [Longimicrobium terrae]MBB6070518.1 hypothetical protein [Longimicrobium terrae]NNC29508.1 carbohydrate binding family 9 domain-containing protein [Longimicrobium terrae]
MIRTPGWARAAACALCAGCFLFRPAAAQTPRKQQQAVRVSGAAPQVDGRLDDAAWAAAPVLSDFVQKEPVQGAEPSVRTEIRFVYDDNALYVGARMYAGAGGPIRAPLTRRDNGGQAERLLLSLDTYLDRRTAYTFGVTAAGVRLDYYNATDEEYNRDASFNPVWSAQTRVDSLGWTAEMRIPFSQLRFNDLPEQTWGFNLNRFVPAREEDIYWVPIPRGVEAWSSRFGELSGIRGVRPSRRAELVPYVAAEGTRRGEVDEDDPFARSRSGTVRAGADARIGLGSSLTLEATLNPDFGQVEADPAEVNLSAFETFFSERRPFFTEGSRYLSADGPSYFYSRRIGAAPRARVNAEYVDNPRNSTILGAAKLTGRTQRGLSLGALAAVTDAADARFVAADGDIQTVRVAPRTAWGVVRAAQEFGANASTAGVNLTAVQRGTEEGGLDAAWLPRTAVTGGADWLLRFRGGDYELGGFVGGSALRGDTAAIRRVQTAPAHFFQRPDRDYAVLDATRDGLAGYTAGLSLERRNARHWVWGVSTTAISPGFDVNETGRMQVADYTTADGELTYRETQPSGVHRGYEIEVEMENGWDYQGLRRHGVLALGGGITWANYWQTSATVVTQLRRQDASATRGGPRVGFDRGWAAEFNASGRQTSLVRWGTGMEVRGDAQGGRGWGVEVSAAANPGPNWQISIEPYYDHGRDPRQYVGTLGGGPAATGGVRYLFSAIDRSTLAAPVRLSYTVTPDLSVEVYAEPFAASGQYSGFGQVPRARAFGLDPLDETEIRSCGGGGDGCAPGSHVFIAGGENETIARDFNVRSLRSNAVLRWEWKPGSTLFLVWQQDRSSSLPYGDAVGPRALGDLFEVPGNNFLALKMTYWLPVQ